MDLADSIQVALGQQPVDLLLKNGRLVNVLSGEIHPASVAIHRGRVVGFGDYEAIEAVDLDNGYILPGFIDGHLHLESSMLNIPEFAANVVPLGTTTVVADPHEIANVMGLDGIRYILETSADLHLNVFVMFPSCVPATPFETSGAELTHEDMEVFRDNDRVLGLAEMMNYPGVLFGDPEILAKIRVFQDKVLDGHAPGLTGKDLCAYLAAGIGSDHECTSLEEAREKLRGGMRIMIREGSAAKNLDALLPLVNDHNSRNCFFVTDDLEPSDIMEQGHINRLVAKAMRKGMDPVRAIQMASINAARYFGLKGYGAVAPGYRGDVLVAEDLEDLKIQRVYASGQLVARNGHFLGNRGQASSAHLPSSVNVNWAKVRDLSVAAQGSAINVIQVIPGQIVTKRVVEQALVSNGNVFADPARDILKMAVIERHRGTGAFSVGFIRGFGLERGAIAGTVAHDSHNIVVVGTNDEDMLTAARHAAAMGGGMTAVENATVVAELPLPIAGLMSDGSIQDVRENLDKLTKAAHEMGCKLENPFATLSFMALTPIPELKLTDQGLFDSLNFRFISLFDVS
ncbi:MAG TPA: adenine deaminase [Desulfomonilaceae bacterium]|nr:adenine deaminase [Desulfomonilaceae bacterium]